MGLVSLPLHARALQSMPRMKNFYLDSCVGLALGFYALGLGFGLVLKMQDYVCHCASLLICSFSLRRDGVMMARGCSIAGARRVAMHPNCMVVE